jgi:hypothetical protein
VKLHPEIIFPSVVEGDIDEAVVRRLLDHVSVIAGAVYGRKGKEWIRKNMSGFLNASRFSPWVILVDLDGDAACPPPVLLQWVPAQQPQFLCFRIAVREIEAWLMSDPETLADFLSVAQTRVPGIPEELPDPKSEMVSLAGRSRRRAVRDDMCPRPGSGTTTGPAYASRLIEYAASRWRPGVAARKSDSLLRTIGCLERIRSLWLKRGLGNS